MNAYEIIEAAQQASGEPLDAEQAARAIKAATDKLDEGRIRVDTWKLDADLWELLGNRRLQGERAAYKVDRIEVTGTYLRHDVDLGDCVPGLRVRVTIASEGEIEGGTVLGWLAVER